MIPRVIAARHVRDYIVHIRFADGIAGEIDLKSELDGEVFEPLKAIDYFKRLTVDPDLHTLTWPNGADFAPERRRLRPRIPLRESQGPRLRRNRFLPDISGHIVAVPDRSR